jgi:lysophospholipase L1-like esterase
MFALGGTTAMRAGHLTARRHACSKDASAAKSCSFWDTKAFEQIGAFQPHVLVMMFGTNDSKDTLTMLLQHFHRDYTALLAKLGAGVLVRILALPPKIYNDGLIGINQTTYSQTIRPLISKIALEQTAELIDLQAVLDKDPTRDMGFMPSDSAHSDSILSAKFNAAPAADLQGDGIHPEADGARAIAAAVATAIRASYKTGGVGALARSRGE